MARAVPAGLTNYQALAECGLTTKVIEEEEADEKVGIVPQKLSKSNYLKPPFEDG
jgi:hypothetical protein